ncbi:hypothetical protein WDU94_013203 [Cyamophila willieti]
MKEEVEKLSDKIGIPKNEEDDRIDFGLGNTHNILQLTKQDHFGLLGLPLATTFARAPTLSNLRQISKSQTSSSSLDLEKELEALESYSDVELNEAEILDTLTMLNINPKLLENEHKFNAANKQETSVDPLRNSEKDKSDEQKNEEFSSKEHSKDTVLENSSKITKENNTMSHTNSSNENQEKTDNNESTPNVQIGDYLEEIDERIDSTHETDNESDEDSVIEEPSSKCKSVSINKLNEINATLFAKKPEKPRPESNKDDNEELEETVNYSEDDFEKHSDESEEEEIEEDFNENEESGDENEDASEEESDCSRNSEDSGKI